MKQFFKKSVGWLMLVSGSMGLIYAIIKTFGILLLGLFVAVIFGIVGFRLVLGD